MTVYDELSFLLDDSGENALLIDDSGNKLLYSATAVAAIVANPPIFWIDVEDSSGTKYGSGPITSATYWRSAARLSRAGDFEFEMPASDPQAALIAAKRVVKCYAVQDGALTLQGAGIIDRVEVSVGPPAMLRISGDDLTRELTWRVINELYVTGGAPGTDPVLVEFVDESTDPETTSDLTNTYDGNSGTYDEIEMYSNGPGRRSALYIHFASFPDAIYFELSSFNSVTGIKANRFAYHEGGNDWEYMDINDVVDETGGYGSPWKQSGKVSWPVPNDVVIGGRAAGPSNWIIRCTSKPDGLFTYGPVRINRIYAVTGPATPGTDIADIMDYAPAGWSLDTANWYEDTDDSEGVLVVGKTVLAALVERAEQTGQAFRISDREVEWLRTDTPASGIRIIGPAGDPALIAAETDLAVIGLGGLRKLDDTYDEVTRIYPYGAGNGPARLTLANATDSAPAGYTLSTTGNYLEVTGASVQIDRFVDFPNIRPVDGTDAGAEGAANRLLAAAWNWLEANSGYTAYELTEVYGLPASLQVGETVRVVYREYVDAYAVVDIDADLVVLDIEKRIDARGVQVARLTVATKNRQPVTEEDALADTIEKVAEKRSYPQEQDGRYLTNMDAYDETEDIADSITAHTADADAHHTWPLTDGDIPSSIARDSEVTSAIGSHAGSASAHHTWPLTDGDIPSSIARDSEVTSAISSHAGNADAHHAQAHTVASHSDTTATGAELETLTNGSDAGSLHIHDARYYRENEFSSNPGAASSPLKSDSSGFLDLEGIGVGTYVSASERIAASGNLLIGGRGNFGAGLEIGGTGANPTAGRVVVSESSAAGTPSTGTIVEYVKTDGRKYYKNDTGTEYGPL